MSIYQIVSSFWASASNQEKENEIKEQESVTDIDWSDLSLATKTEE